jgi:small subunit ribosomal protein S19
MSRAKWKGPFVNPKHFTSIEELKKQNTKKTKLVMTRDSEIVPAFVGLSFNVYNGKSYSEITVSENMIGHKFGEFSFTRAKFAFKKKKKK